MSSRKSQYLMEHNVISIHDCLYDIKGRTERRYSESQFISKSYFPSFLELMLEGVSLGRWRRDRLLRQYMLPSLVWTR